MAIPQTFRDQTVKFLPYLLILLQSTLYGFGDPISKAAYEVMPVFPLLSVRYLIALVFLLAVFGKQVISGLKTCSVKDWLLPSLCTGGAYVANNIALQLTAATSVAFLRSLSTVMTPLLGLVVFRRFYSKKHIPAQLLVVVGLYLLCGLGGLSSFGWGEVFSLLSALLLAGSLIFGETALDRMNPITLTTLQTAVSAAMAVIGTILLGDGWHLEVATPKVWAIIVYLAILCTIAGYLLQNMALKFIPARTVALLQCSCPVLTAVFSRVLLNEHLTFAGLVGAGIILLCVAAETLMSEDNERRLPIEDTE